MKSESSEDHVQVHLSPATHNVQLAGRVRGVMSCEFTSLARHIHSACRMRRGRATVGFDPTILAIASFCHALSAATFGPILPGVWHASEPASTGARAHRSTPPCTPVPPPPAARCPPSAPASQAAALHEDARDVWVSHLEALVAEKGVLMVGVECSRCLTSNRKRAGLEWYGAVRMSRPYRAASMLVWNRKGTEFARVGWAKNKLKQGFC